MRKSLGAKGAAHAQESVSEERIIEILRRVEEGQRLIEVCREEGIGDATYYCWKAQYGADWR